MIPRTYPYKGWILQPAFKPVEIKLTQLVAWYDDYDSTASGKSYALTAIFPSKAAAIAEGRARIVKQQADLDKRQATVQKRINALNKAETS